MGPILNDLYRTNGLVRGRVKSSTKRAFLVQQLIKGHRPQHGANMEG